MPSEEHCLREMVNVGVTAKLSSPEYRTAAVLQSSSTEETETTQLHARYRKFLNEHSSTPSQRIIQTTGSDDSKTLYQLKTIDEGCFPKAIPSKIEFSLYRKTKRNPHPRLSSRKHIRPKKSHSSLKRLIESESKSEEVKPPRPTEGSFVGKLKNSLKTLKQNQAEKEKEKLTRGGSPKCQRGFADIYPFDHGCAEHLRTAEYSPQIISELLAQRATDYATRFWAEIFGSLHIGVAFFLTFFIQTYRFILYSVVRSVIVGLLQMTSDYGIKPLLAVIFNGFVQPVLIFTHNILSSVRDVLRPISETMNNFLKPIGVVLKSIRLVTVKNSDGKGGVKSV